MSPGQPFSLYAVLPSSITPDDFYVLLAGFAAFLVVFLVGRSFAERDTLTPRLKALQERRLVMKGELLSTKRKKEKRTEEQLDIIKRIVKKLKLLPREQVNKIQAQLISAGFRSKDTIYVFSFFKAVLPIVFLALSFLLVKIDWSNPGASGWHLFVPIAMAYFGLKLPDIIVRNARDKRNKEIQKALADTLDLMTICAEAGLSLPSSLDRVSRELRLSYPIMADELGLASVEMGFLPERQQALYNLASRVDLPEVRGIVSVLIQTERYGTPIAQALRVLSQEFRTARMLRAEQKAARLPAIMTVPMIIFILPTLFIVVIAPAAIRVMDTFK